MPSSRYLNSVLTVIAVLLAMNVWSGLVANPVEATPARADGLPNAAAQRLKMIDQLKLVTLKLDAIHKSLEGQREASQAAAAAARSTPPTARPASAPADDRSKVEISEQR